MGVNTYPEAYISVYKDLMEIERGYANHPADPGGETMYGIAKAYWPKYWRNGPPGPATARHFYYEEFWVPLGLPGIKDAALRYEIFEAAVNCGLVTGATFVQKGYNLIRPTTWPVLKVDGNIGPVTTEALNRATTRYRAALLNAANYYQAEHYVAVRESVRAEFIRGWFGSRLGWMRDGD